MDTFDTQIIETTIAVEASPVPAQSGQQPLPFTCEMGDEATHYASLDEAYEHICEKLGNELDLVTRRLFGARQLGVWVREYDVFRDPDAVISWAAGARRGARS